MRATSATRRAAVLGSSASFRFRPNVPAINGRDAALLQRGEGALAAETQQKQNSAGCEGGQLGLYTESTVDRFFLDP